MSNARPTALLHWLAGRLSAAVRESAWALIRLPGRFRERQGKKVVHLLHIGKCGGTALKYAIRRNLASERFAIVTHKHEFALSDVPRGEKVAFIVRDPISRFVSGFYSRQRQGLPRTFVPWTAEEKRAFERFSTPQQLAGALSSGNSEERSRAVDAMNGIGHVRHRYSHWLGSEAYFLSRSSDIFFIGFQESLARDFEILKGKLGLPASLRLPDDEVEAHRNPRELDRTLDEAAQQNLRVWYAEDLRLVELCRVIAAEQGDSKSHAGSDHSAARENS